MDRQSSSSSGGLTKLGFGVLACNSALAVFRSWGDPGAVAFVLIAAASLVPLVLCLRVRGDNAKTKAAVWALLTATAVVASGAAAPTTTAAVPLVVGGLVFLCLRDVDQVLRAGDEEEEEEEEEGDRDMDAPYCALAKVGCAVLTCVAALDGGDAGSSAAVVFASYAVLVTLTGLLVRAVARAHGQGYYS